MKSAFFTIFSILLFFWLFWLLYCSIKHSFFLIANSSFFLCYSVPGQFDIQKHWATSAPKASFRSIVLTVHVYKIMLCLWRRCATHKNDRRANTVWFSCSYQLRETNWCCCTTEAYPIHSPRQSDACIVLSYYQQERYIFDNIEEHNLLTSFSYYLRFNLNLDFNHFFITSHFFCRFILNCWTYLLIYYIYYYLYYYYYISSSVKAVSSWPSDGTGTDCVCSPRTWIKIVRRYYILTL